MGPRLPQSLRTNLRQHIGAAGRTDLTFQASTYLEEKQFELLGAAASLAEAELSDLIDALPDAAIEPHGSGASQT